MKPIHISPNFHHHINSPNLPRPPPPSHNQYTSTHNGRPIFLAPNNKRPVFIEKKSQIQTTKKYIIEDIDKNRIGKENYSPIIIEQRKQGKQSKRKMITSSQCRLQISSKKVLNQKVPVNNDFQITPFNQSNFLMDAYCSKMSQSIIMSDQTVPSSNQIPMDLGFQDFKKIKFLGRGNFGQVYLVIHKITGFICAIKIIQKKLLKQQKIQSQLAKEIRIHNSMRNLNIINFYGFFQDRYNLYLLLQYACQGSLYSKLKGKNRLQQHQIKPIVKYISQGVKYIHRMGFIHRDLKPQNIVMQFNIPKICDFGWATTCYQSQLCKSFCGTPLYLAPEMVKKEKYNNMIDIWSIGLLTYQILVGRGPFGIWSQNDLNNILQMQISYPNYIDRSKDCEQFIAKCLQKNAQYRISINNILQEPFMTDIENKQLDFQFYDEYAKIFNIY